MRTGILWALLCLPGAAQEAARTVEELNQAPPAEVRQGRVVVGGDELRLDFQDLTGSNLFCTVEGDRQLRSVFSGVRQDWGGWQAQLGVQESWLSEEQRLQASQYRLRLNRPGLCLDGSATLNQAAHEWTGSARLEGPLQSSLFTSVKGLDRELTSWQVELSKRLWGNQSLTLARARDELGTLDSVGLQRLRDRYSVQCNWKRRLAPDSQWQEADLELRVFW